MRIADGTVPKPVAFVMLGVLACVTILADVLQAQQNLPYNADNAVGKTTSGTNAPVNSHAYVDASIFYSGDVCLAIGTALTQISTNTDYKAKSVVDARGIYAPSLSTPLACGASPWSTVANPPTAVTILLPAATIAVGATWQLPTNTQIIGVGPRETTLQAATGMTDLIDMGILPAPPAIPCSLNDCNGMAIKHLTLDGGSGNATNLIVNRGSQEQSYVEDVQLQGLSPNGSGTGLLIIGQDNAQTGYAVNSGPYSNIYFSGAGVCANIQGTYGTRGIHGLTCIGSGSGSAVLIDGSNNSIEDVFLSNYTDGVVIGSQTAMGSGLHSENNVLLNIRGDSSITNAVVHICGPVGHSPCPANPTSYPADIPKNLTIMGITNRATSPRTIQDDLTNSALADTYIGMYILGETVSGFSVSSTNGPTSTTRFTTSQSVPTWYVGSTPPTSGSSCQTGSLFSMISGTSTPSLSLCAGGVWGGFSNNH